eukprot:scaffold153_cov347-Pavlova_lutheri.AAC.17
MHVWIAWDPSCGPFDGPRSLPGYAFHSCDANPTPIGSPSRVVRRDTCPTRVFQCCPLLTSLSPCLPPFPLLEFPTVRTVPRSGGLGLGRPWETSWGRSQGQGRVPGVAGESTG